MDSFYKISIGIFLSLRKNNPDYCSLITTVVWIIYLLDCDVEMKKKQLFSDGMETIGIDG